ncbi:MAG: PHP domain-containing protein, partial [Lutispora sp.]
MNYYHVHSTLSNATTVIDSITNYSTYIDKAKEYGCKSFGFSEHGNLLNWYHKKQAIEKAGMKYIHGVEMYVTETLDKKIRDNYHVILMARNLEGFKELNKLVSKGFNRAETKVIDDKERFYYNPRISYDELKETSDNIILTTACIGGILSSSNEILKKDFINFMVENKHKCFLEIQHHQTIQQANYNKYLIQLHEKYGIPLIAGTDTHMLTEDEFRGRELLQKRKNIHFDNEEGWSLALYDRNTLIEMYKKQNAIDEKYYMQALDSTNLLDDLIESYNIDTSNKYPEISDTPYEDVLNLCKQGIEEKGLKFADELKDRIYYELDVYEQNKALELMLLEYDVKKWARDNNIFYGESRGSVSGSMVAYLMDITKVNSMKYNMNFERFMNNERVGGLADIDSDWMPSRRDDVKEYLHNNPKFYTSEIITFNTIAEKGSIRDIGGALDIPLETINDICKNLENTKIIDDYKKQYPDLFKYAKQVEGTITSIGSHPAATICSPVDIVESISTITLDTNKYPVSSLNMDEVESLNYLKLDLLGLKNVEIIYNTCKLAGIKLLKSDDMDFDDEEVWKDIMKSPVGIF